VGGIAVEVVLPTVGQINVSSFSVFHKPKDEINLKYTHTRSAKARYPMVFLVFVELLILGRS